jgi:hypothetical protein
MQRASQAVRCGSVGLEAAVLFIIHSSSSVSLGQTAVNEPSASVAPAGWQPSMRMIQKPLPMKR